MPVGTKATVKGLMTDTVRDLGAKIILANTYHLSQRPGDELVAQMGGLHDFMQWHGPILTDSGGFQVFSHEEFMKLSDEGVKFRAVDYDGAWSYWTPETNMQIAQNLGADIVMQLDQCVGYPAERKKVDFPGYGIGGYSVGEPHEVMFETLAPLCADYMPRNKPRYLMGVGNPSTLIRGVACGIDMFDCVLPTRTARMGTAFSHEGRMNLKNAKYFADAGPIDAKCTCPVCTGGYSRAYINHLVKQHEMLGGQLLSMHNIYFLLELMRQAREAILAGTYSDFVEEWENSDGVIDF